MRFETCWIPLLALLATTFPLAAGSAEQFRGPARDGVFPEDGLLEHWPEEGPPLLWSVEGLGESFASVSLAGGRIFTTLKEGDEGLAVALDLDGKVLWKRRYGSEHNGGGYPGTRTTPTHSDGLLFLLSSSGEAVALTAVDGVVVWKVDLFERFGGKNPRWGLSESPLVDGSKVIFTPGGRGASLVALDKKTGATIWKTTDLSDSAAYCSPRIFDNGRHRQLVTMVAEHLVGIDPESGELLWKVASKVDYDIHAVSPLFEGDRIFVTHGYKQGSRAFELAADGRSVREVWKNEELDVHHGGAVLVDGKIYGASSRKTWYKLDLATGQVEAEISRLGKGSVVWADGKLYGYTENGSVFLVDPERFETISSFEMRLGVGQHWSHPVVADGVLYIRHGDVLAAFDVRAK